MAQSRVSARWVHLARFRRPFTPVVPVNKWPIHKGEQAAEDAIDVLGVRARVERLAVKMKHRPNCTQYQELHFGLFHGETPRSRILVSWSEKKHKKWLQPNVQWFTMHSEILNQDLYLRATTRCNELIEEMGGIDHYILRANPREAYSATFVALRDVLRAELARLEEAYKADLRLQADTVVNMLERRAHSSGHSQLDDETNAVQQQAQHVLHSVVRRHGAGEFDVDPEEPAAPSEAHAVFHFLEETQRRHDALAASFSRAKLASPPSASRAARPADRLFAAPAWKF